MTASVHTLPTRSEPELTVARETLAIATRTLRDELDAFEAVTAPAQRLGQLSVDLSTIDAEIAEARSAHEQVLGLWLAQGQIGDRPMPSLKISMLEHRRQALALDVEAAERMRPGVEVVHQQAAERVRVAQARRDEALVTAAVEAAIEFASSTWVSQLRSALASEAVLRGLAVELQQLSNRIPTAAAAAQAIAELVQQTRRNVTTAHNTEPGRRLIEALNSDARAAL